MFLVLNNKYVTESSTNLVCEFFNVFFDGFLTFLCNIWHLFLIVTFVVSFLYHVLIIPILCAFVFYYNE